MCECVNAPASGQWIHTDIKCEQNIYLLAVGGSFMFPRGEPILEYSYLIYRSLSYDDIA